METAIGVFSSRERAEEAVQELLGKHVPQESIAYLTRSETEAKSVGKQLGATVGGFMGGAVGMSAGVAAATLLLRELGPFSHSDLERPHCWDWVVREPARRWARQWQMKLAPFSQPQMKSAQRTLNSSGRCWERGDRWLWFAPTPPKPFSWLRKFWTGEEWRFKDTLRFQCKRLSARWGMLPSWISAVELPWVKEIRITRSSS